MLRGEFATYNQCIMSQVQNFDVNCVNRPNPEFNIWGPIGTYNVVFGIY